MESTEVLARAAYLVNQHLYPNEFRHEMLAASPDPGNPAPSLRLNCPRPRGKTNQLPDVLAMNLIGMHMDKRSQALLQTALQTYLENVNRENFVQFANIEYAESARRLLYFLTEMGVPRGSIQCFSGDRSQESDHRKGWSKRLGLGVRPRPSAGDFGPATAVSIRPRVEFGDQISISRAAFRFLLVTAYLFFGPILHVGIEGVSALKATDAIDFNTANDPVSVKPH